MPLDRSSWIKYIDQVPDGASRRFNHDCGEGRTLMITQEAGRYRAFCFRCVEPGNHVRERNLDEVLASIKRQRDADDAVKGVSSKPEPATYNVDDWPVPAKLWFYRAGLGRADIGRLGAYYHEPSNRVVLPITSSDGMGDWWQARAFTQGQVPKYLGPDNADRSRVCPRFGAGQLIVLTEDILSAYKVGNADAGAEGWCMMGVALQPWVMNQLQKAGKAVVVWLDPDPAGQRAAARVLRELRMFGVSCRNIVSTLDPKVHTYKEIRSYLT
jgi:Toprim-like